MFNFFQNKLSNRNKVTRKLLNSDIDKRIVISKKNSKLKKIGKSVWINILMGLLIIGFVGVTLYVLLFSSLLTIKLVIVDGAESLDKQIIIATANNILDRKYFNIFDGSNLILADTNSVSNLLLDKFKKIEKVKITKKFPDKLLINIQERGSSMVFCSGEKCFIIDRNGQAYAMANFQINSLDEQSLPILRDLSQKNISLANIILESGYIDFFKNIKSALANDLNLEVKQEWSTSSLISGDLRAETAEGWKIYFNSSINANKEIEMLKTVLANSIDKNSRDDLEYIDLRLDNKVYYKLKSVPVVKEEGEKATPVIEANDIKKKKNK